VDVVDGVALGVGPTEIPTEPQRVWANFSASGGGGFYVSLFLRGHATGAGERGELRLLPQIARLKMWRGVYVLARSMDEQPALEAAAWRAEMKLLEAQMHL
jgi:hypothetical protein